MKYPNIMLDQTYVTRSGKKLTSVLRESYPGDFSTTSNIIFQWGQRTEFPANKKTVIFDCGYFRRSLQDGGNRHYRLSINEYHPTKLPPAPPGRWEKLDIEIESLFDERGPVILVGRGGKTRSKQSANGPDWEVQTLAKIKKVLPGKKVIYRPKSVRRVVSTEAIPGAVTDGATPIRELLNGASLVVTQWSNIGNEALCYGIPVVTEGGPASDVCPNNIKPGQQPLSYEERADFLHRLAYWQWSIDEIKKGEIWPWLMDQVEKRK